MADISITAANVLPSNSGTNRGEGIVAAGVTIAPGDVIAMNATGILILADANATAPANGVNGVFIAEDGGSAGQTINYISNDVNGLAIGGTVAAGAVLVLSATPGKMCPVADLASGWLTVVLGIGIGSNKIKFSPLIGGAVP
jgi:hypothetical protein